MKTIAVNEVLPAWGPRSLSFWLTVLCALGLIALGINGFIQPQAASKAFGLEIVSSQDSGFVRVKATRDLAVGLAIVVFLLCRMPKALLAFAFVSATIPLLDGIWVLTQYGGEVKDSWQHFITALFVLCVAWRLWHELRRSGSFAESEQTQAL
ncbi:DUF4267 domain-containing protein [Paenibacillus sp. 1P07SE]|uniref:DUF4267 domain-containing protein n=1 Tax=Paenibacillus sp. 1P07SE TaxID=3132209 RepID=UPI0039A768C0